ncbi:hypothetical protein CYY_008121 [Polysphondylium violaceum]|uniref:Phospholipid-transporting ATPase n=1 Tax=Polysphondylium violaceum TaxID=133409 RepID=A0A8J4UXJ2_9MYCE|nr:hypothetical protein CYY_008121 [Polysphondylium violaceum]
MNNNNNVRRSGQDIDIDIESEALTNNNNNNNNLDNSNNLSTSTNTDASSSLNTGWILDSISGRKSPASMDEKASLANQDVNQYMMEQQQQQQQSNISGIVVPNIDSDYNGSTPSTNSSPPKSPTLSRASSSHMNGSSSQQPGQRKGTVKSSSLRSNKPKKKAKPLKKLKKKKYIGTQRDIYINQRERNALYKFCNNKISTTKYTPFTFIPKNLYEQFRRAANFYFLVIAVIQLIPGISPVNAYTTWIPLIFVLLVTAVKEGIEDFKRNQSDNTVNNLNAKVLSNNQFSDLPWKQLQVGDIVKVVKGERFPADLIILNSSEQHGVCYIETSNLDGETNLKQRQAIPQTFEILRDEQDLSRFNGTIECEHPNNVIYVFNGTVRMTEEGTRYPLNNNQTLLRGCVLRNTEWIYGVVVYTGEDTKLMQNSTDAPSKRSTLEKLVNRALINLFAIMFAVCLIGTVVSVVYTAKYKTDAWYLGFKDNAVRKAVLNFFSFMIAFAVMIPISLYVSLELVKVAQAIFIYWDINMYHEESDTPAKTRTSNLSEELGQIEYVFSDKTGTLTRNQMDFLKCSVGKMVYGNLEKEDQPSTSSKYGVQMDGIPGADPKFGFKDRRILDHLDEDPNSEQAFLINEFLTLLAVCHSVVPDRPNKDDSEIIYEASSPDEAALVYAAKNLGYAFYNRDPTGVFVNVRGKGIERFELLNVLEFNSDRKRMSVIVRSPQGRIILYCKGADTTVLPLLRKDQEDIYSVTLEFLQDFAADGLRTLCLAYTFLEEEEYAKWNEIYKEAAIAIQDRDAKVDKAAELIEKNLTLLGSTAIEDKLQVGVPQAIANIIKANIKIWVLTGDKQETAINIGFSCHLLNSDMRIIILNGKTEEEVQNQIQGAIDAYFSDDIEDHPSSGFALVVEGVCLNFALEGPLKTVFLQLASNCKSVICCRTTPLQKAQVVKMVRDTLRAVTLAIGDGANDVSMIQAAHIGVGISGNEGMQAVMASDYAIAQFRFLYRLLVVHGRWDYKRNSRLMLYCFYKNMVFAMTQFWFGIFNMYSAQTIFDSWSISIFNVVFTGLPIIVYAILDQDVSAESSMKYPQLYASGQKDSEFNLRILWIWILEAWVHSVVVFFGVYGIYQYGGNLLESGLTLDLWSMGQNIFIVVVLTVNLKLALETRYWTWLTHFSIWGSILIWFIWVSVLAVIPGIGSSSSGEVYQVAFKVFSSAYFWFSLAVLPVICLVPDTLYKYIQRDIKPYSFQIVQELERIYGKPSDIMDKDLLQQQDDGRKYKSSSNVADIEELNVESSSNSLQNEKRKKKRIQFLSWMKSSKVHKKNTGFAFSHPNQNKTMKDPSFASD